MSKRNKFRKDNYNKLCERDGERCHICGKKPPEVYLEIQYRNDNKRDTHLDNLWLLCRSDVRKQNHRGKGKHKKEIIPQRRVIAISTYNDIMESSDMSPEMRQNRRAEPLFRHWLFKKIKEKGKLTVQQVIAAGAEVAGCSTYAIRTNYLPKVTSEEGLYVMFHDEEAKKNMIQFRNAADIGIMLDAIDFKVVEEEDE
jgi:hypothetical protein